MSKCKVDKHSKCSKGEHQFVISDWVVSQTRQTANSFTCQWCLHSVEGKHDVVTLREAIHIGADDTGTAGKGSE